MQYAVNYWAFVILGTAMLTIIIQNIKNFSGLSTEDQLKKVSEWLVYATTMAEKEFGSGTGKIKLRYVYDLFVSKFPDVAKMLSFDMFADMVDVALEEMKIIIETNADIKDMVMK